MKLSQSHLSTANRAPLNALLIALFAGWILRKKVVDEEFTGDSPAWRSYWRFANRYLTPAALIINALSGARTLAMV